MKKDLRQIMAERGLTPLPFIQLALGRAEATGFLGKGTVQAALASAKFPGNKRAIARATWEPYVYENADQSGFVVTAPEWRSLAKSSGRTWPCFEAAMRHIAHLNEYGDAWRPPNPRYHISEWEGPPPKVVAFDCEGVGQIDRISVASHTQSLTCQWDEATRIWLTSLLAEAETVLAHNAPFDWGMLVNMGVETPQEKWVDTMIAHQVLNPWRRRGLGCAAPLYVPGLMPWKHLSEGDMEEYSLVDAAVLIPMWDNMRSQFACTHQRKAFDLEMAWTWAQYNRGCHMEGYRVDGKESDLTKAALIPESCPTTLSAVRAAVGVLCSQAPSGSLPPEVERRHLLGYGVRTLRRGSRELSPLPQLQSSEKELETAASLSAYDAENPQFVKWRDHVWSLAKREGFIVAPSGHRAYGFRKGEAQRFLIWNALATQHKESTNDAV